MIELITTWFEGHSTIAVASAALVLGLFNLFHTVYLGRRDKEKLVAKCSFWNTSYDSKTGRFLVL